MLLIIFALLTTSTDRIGVGYDCAESPHDYNCIVDEIDTLDYSPGAWINWEDSYAHFGVWNGYTTESILSQDIAQKMPALKAEVLKHMPHDVPVLVLVGARVFVIPVAYTAFFATARRRCPDCVDFVAVDASDDMTQDLITLQLHSMWTAGDITDTSIYDTILYYRAPQTWSEYRDTPELSALVAADPMLPGMLFAKRYLLSPHDLTYMRMVGPGPDVPEYVPAKRDTRSPWRRMVDRYVKSQGYDDLDAFRSAEGWDPMSRTPMAMQYFTPLRHVLQSIPWEHYTHRYGVSDHSGPTINIGGVEYYESEQELEDRIRAEELYITNDRINKLTGEDVTVDEVIGRGPLPLPKLIQLLFMPRF